MSEVLVDKTPSIMDQARNTRLGRFVAVGLAAAAFTGAAEVATGEAEAKATNVPVEKKIYKENNTEFTETSSTTVLVGSAAMSAEAFTKVKVVGNLRTVSKAKINKLKRQGKCDFFTAKQIIKKGYRTQGHDGKMHLENRASTLCDSNGDGVYDVRAECGNKARGGRPKPKQAKKVLWVNNINKSNVKLRSTVEVVGKSGCELNFDGGRVYADAYGRAASTTTVSMKMRAAIKARGKGLTLLKNRQLSSMSIEMKQDAIADAQATCVRSGGKVTPEVPTKDGTKGPGEGTPGQPGGPGAGGQPGNVEEGVICRDTNDTVNGDQNANTQGDLMYGKEVDQFGYCVGKAAELK